MLTSFLAVCLEYELLCITDANEALHSLRSYSDRFISMEHVDHGKVLTRYMTLLRDGRVVGSCT